MALLEVEKLNVRFATPDGEVHAVKDLSFYARARRDARDRRRIGFGQEPNGA